MIVPTFCVFISCYGLTFCFQCRPNSQETEAHFSSNHTKTEPMPQKLLVRFILGINCEVTSIAAIAGMNLGQP